MDTPSETGENTTTAQAVLEPLGVHRTPESGERILPKVSDVPKGEGYVNKMNNVLRERHPSYVEAERKYHNSPDSFHGSPDPTFVVVHELPEHRIVLFLKAEGKSNREAAEVTGYSESWVSQITRQPWFRLNLIRYLNEAGRDQIATVLKSAALDSVFNLIDLRDDPKTPAAVKRACDDSLLDRFLGKPKQTVETTERKLPSTDEISNVETQLADIDRQLAEPTNEKPQT